MDKQILVKSLDKVFAALENRGWQVIDYRIMPAYLGFRSLPLLIGIVVPAMTNTSVGERVKATIPVLHEVLTPEERKLISGLLVYDSIDAMNDDMDEREGVGRPVVEPYWPD